MFSEVNSVMADYWTLLVFIYRHFIIDEHSIFIQENDIIYV